MIKNKNHLLVFIFLLLPVSVYIGLSIGSKNNPVNAELSEDNAFGKKESEEEKEAGPEIERTYFARNHQPYGYVIEPKVLDEVWRDIKSMPKEQDFGNPGMPWVSIGPYGSQVPGNNTKYTGRILDINIKDTSNILVASASGGLWKAGNPPIPLTEQLTSQVASSFDVQPGNNNVIILGTGEPFMRGGTGLYKTTNGGTNWARVLVNDSSCFYKVRYSSTSVVHACSQNGYYRSDDNGANWTKYFSGNVSDFAVHPAINNFVYICKWSNDSGGVYKTADAGNNWNRMTNGIQTTDVGRTSVAIAPSSPNVVYVLMSKADQSLSGFYKTIGGDFWQHISTPGNIFGDLGHYANVIAVSPTRDSTVMIGGVFLGISTNSGASWVNLSSTNINVHADQHAIKFNSTGTSVWVGNDGGLSFSNDMSNFNTLNNNWPITQYNTIDFSLSNPNIIIGGSQDNGITGTTDGGTTWANPHWGLDGSGTAINPFISSEWYTTTGFYSGSWAFQRRRTTDGGINWTSINTGIGSSVATWTKIKTDNSNPISIYTNSSRLLYYSTNKGDNWIQRNTPEFPTFPSDFSVRKYGDTSVIYVCIESNDVDSRLFVQTGSGAFTEVSGDIPGGLYIQAVTMHPGNSNTAYAVIRGMYQAHKVYKTVNRGVNWVNLNSNLPNVPALSMTLYPNNDNILYLGTEMGCFKSTSGGSNWFRWNDGLPEAVIVTDLKSYFSGGEFYVLGGTYGRGVWKRKDDDLVILPGISQEIPDKFLLHQNYPNPFNPVTEIKLSVPRKGKVELHVYDVTGRLTSTLINAVMEAGVHNINFDGSNLASGVYFYRVTAEGFTDVKKMILIK